MPASAVLLPVFIEVALTFALLFTLGPSRVAAIRRGEVKLKDVALGQKVWPARIIQLGNSFDSQFQLPVLFYALVALALVTAKVDAPLVWGAWIFVLSRVLHAAVHVTTNRVSQRFYAFLIGALVLVAMWIWFAIRTLGTTP